jgi:CheY-like chemotaxis protein
MIRTKSKSALLIDDDRNSLTILQSELLKLGYIVTAVNHPSRVNETLERMDQIDIIFLDLEMPVSSGFEVLEQLREMDIDAPIVAHTVHIDHLNEMRRKGFDGLIAKPLNLDVLSESLYQIINGESVWQTT